MDVITINKQVQVVFPGSVVDLPAHGNSLIDITTPIRELQRQLASMRPRTAVHVRA